MRRYILELLPYIVCLLLSAFAISLYYSFRSEVNARRSATCQSFESSHLQEVKQLTNLYGYLDGLTIKQAREPINRFLIKVSLPQVERDAQSDQDNNGTYVPLYCDLPGYGLPEPDPVVPHRPASLARSGLGVPPQPRGATR